MIEGHQPTGQKEGVRVADLKLQSKAQYMRWNQSAGSPVNW